MASSALYQLIKAITIQCWWCFPRYRDLSVLGNPNWRSFWWKSISPPKFTMLYQWEYLDSFSRALNVYVDTCIQLFESQGTLCSNPNLLLFSLVCCFLKWDSIFSLIDQFRLIRDVHIVVEIEVGRYTQLPLEERICQLCHQGVESGEHYVCHCSVFYEIRGDTIASLNKALAHYTR